MEQLFYRFRRVENLLGRFKELERQSIFFAAPDELNDPMEGFSDIYWSGDKIVWKNLFRNYVMCLEHVFAQLCIGGEENCEFSANDIITNISIDNYPTQEYKDLVEKILNDFFDDNINKLIDKISIRTTPVKRDELFFYLKNIHPHAFAVVKKNFEENNLLSKTELVLNNTSDNIKKIIDEGFFESLEQLVKDHGEEAVPQFCSVYRNAQDQVILISNFNNNFSEKKNLYFILNFFTEKYIKRLETLCYMDWYTACFMTECKNSSIWGSYGDNHAGICLIFKAGFENGKHVLPFRDIVSYSFTGDNETTIHYDFKKHILHPINYQEEFLSFNFFTNLGSLNRHTSQKMWFSDAEGNHSSCSAEMWKDPNSWRETYWNNYIKINTTKTIDWSYENEYRVILDSFFTDYSDKSKRTLVYDFNSLHGLIFGINTKLEDKLKIMSIIESKCLENERKDFNFYQAYYSSKDKCINHYPLSLIKFKTQPINKEEAP